MILALQWQEHADALTVVRITLSEQLYEVSLLKPDADKDVAGAARGE